MGRDVLNQELRSQLSAELLDAAAVALFVLNRQQILFANTAAAQLARKEPGTLVGKNFLKLFRLEGTHAAQCLQNIFERKQPRVECQVDLHISPRRTMRARLVFQRVNQTSVDLSEQVLVTILEGEADQTPSPSYENSGYEESSLNIQLLDKVFEADPGGLAVVSGRDLVFRMVNPAYQAILPDPTVNPIGKTYEQIWSNEGSIVNGLDQIQKVIQSGQPLDEDRIEIQDGQNKLRVYSFRARPIQWENEPGLLLVVWEITDVEESHRQIEQSVADAQKRANELSEVINAMSDAVFIYDQQGRLQQRNPAAVDLLGPELSNLDREEILKKIDIRRVDGKQVDLADLPLMKALKGQRVRGERLVVTGAKEQPVNAVASASPLYSGGQLVGVVSVWSDVTELSKRRQELEVLVQVAAVLRSAMVQEEMFPSVLEQIINLLNVDGASLLILDPSTGDLVVRAGAGAWEMTEGRRLPAGVGISAEVLNEGLPYVNDNIQNDQRLSRGIFVGTLSSGACVPLSVQGNNIGVLWVGRNSPIARDEVELLNAVANITASNIYRARLFEQTQLRLQRLSALHSIDMAITSSLDLQLTLSVLLDQVVSQMGVSAADILLFDSALHWLEYASGRGFILPSARSSPQRLAETPAGQVALERRTVIIPDLNRFEHKMDGWLVPQEGFRAYFAAPLISKGQVKGVLELFCREVYHPDGEWLEFFETLATQAAIALDSAELFSRLQRSNEELSLAYDATIEGWSRALELRDHETHGHAQRVTELTLRLARRLGIKDEELAHYRRGVLLHDIGKMAIPDSILLKDGPLMLEEQELMRMHPIYAYELLRPIVYLRPALDIPYCHHEWWDGNGYPRGLKAEEIPFSARVFAVVDVWDALRSDRSYRAAWPVNKTLEYIRSHSGTHFDPRVVDEFIKMIQGFDPGERYHPIVSSPSR